MSRFLYWLLIVLFIVGWFYYMGRFAGTFDWLCEPAFYFNGLRCQEGFRL